jgi:hypothetical protein
MSDYQEGEILVNPQTGERIQLVRGEWKPLLADVKQQAGQLAQATQQQESPTASGVLRGMGIGARDIISGAAALPGLAADVATAPFTGMRNLATAGYNKLTGKNVPAAPMIGNTSQALESMMDAFGLPKAQTDTERVISAATRGVAGAATGLGAGGAIGATAAPASNAARLAQVLSTAPRTQLAAGAASPVAGEVVRQEGGSPGAQLAAELATGLAVATPSSVMRSVPTTATADQLRAASRAAYKTAEQAGAVFKPAAFDAFVTNLLPEIKKAAFDETLHPEVAAVLSRLQKEMGKPQTLENMEILRRIAKIAAESQKPSERRMAGIIEDHLDDFVQNAGPADIMGGNPQIAVPALQQARAMYSKASKSDTIDTLIDRAKLSAPNFSASGMENALRTEFRALAKNERKMRLFTPDEQDAIRKVAMGDFPVNALRALGRFGSPGVVGTSLSGGMGMVLGGPVGAVALPLAGRAARAGSAMLQKRNADMAAALMRGGKLSSTGINRDQLAAALAAMGAGNAGQQ